MEPKPPSKFLRSLVPFLPPHNYLLIPSISPFALHPRPRPPALFISRLPFPASKPVVLIQKPSVLRKRRATRTASSVEFWAPTEVCSGRGYFRSPPTFTVVNSDRYHSCPTILEVGFIVFISPTLTVGCVTILFYNNPLYFGGLLDHCNTLLSGLAHFVGLLRQPES